MTPQTMTRVLFLQLLVIGALVCVTAGALYTQLVQRRPQVIAHTRPIPNANEDASGLTYQAAVARGVTLEEQRDIAARWRPVPVTRFRPGDTVWTYRDDCFVDKTTGDVVVEYVGLGASAGKRWRSDPIPPPKRTVPLPADNDDANAGPFGHCSAFNFKGRVPPPTETILEPCDPKTDASDVACQADRNDLRKWYRERVIPMRDVTGAPLWEFLPSEWKVLAHVRFYWTWFLPRVPTYFQPMRITVVP